MNDLNVIHLTSDGTINYLNPNVIEIFSNLNLISATGELVKMNPLSLAAMNSDLTKFLKINQVEEEQDVNNIDQFNTIITEFSTEDLKQLVLFCHQGILPKPLEILEKSEEIPPIFTAFDIDLKKLLFSQENTTTNSKYNKNTAKIKKEKEIQNLIKNEILEDFILDDIVQTLMETETKVGKKRGRKKKNSKNNSQIDHDDLTENDYFDHLMEENDQEVSDHENDQPTGEEEIVTKPKTRRGRKKKYVSNSVIILN